jgi:hypothetical protein
MAAAGAESLCRQIITKQAKRYLTAARGSRMSVLRKKKSTSAMYKKNRIKILK